SVLLRLIHGLLTPTRGSIRCFGAPLSAKVARQQALVFQTPVLLRRIVEANLRFVLKARKQPLSGVDELLETVGLSGLERSPARRLSGGERQRLAIALALATKPRLLFLDEPTASLDPASVLAIENIVRSSVAQNVRIVFVTHDTGQARRLANDVVFLSNGKVLEHAPANRFFDAPETRAAQNYLAGRLTLPED
ncbi:MAG: ATP-binding cassette domain-containing protein, partial [Pseudomonadota bacterium]